MAQWIPVLARQAQGSGLESPTPTREAGDVRVPISFTMEEGDKQIPGGELPVG